MWIFQGVILQPQPAPSKLVWEYLYTISRNGVFQSFYVKHDGFLKKLIAFSTFFLLFFIGSFFWGDVSCWKSSPRAFWVAPHVHAFSGSAFSITAWLEFSSGAFEKWLFQFCLAEPCCNHAKVAEAASGNQITENIRKSWLCLGPFTGLGSLLLSRDN